MVILSHGAQRKNYFFVKTKEKAKSNKMALGKKVDLELLHNILGHRSARSLMAVDTANVY